MNPFDWRGPQFLLFFWAVGAVTLLAAHLLRCRAERGEVPKLRAVDPHLIACLRGGEAESIKLAVISLLERGLLTVDGHLVTAVDGARSKVSLRLERRILQAAASGPVDARALTGDPDIRVVTAPLAHELARQGLTPSLAQRTTRTWIGLGGFAIVSVVAMRKLTLAFARGHHNVGFLILSWLMTTVLLAIVLGRRQSRVGQLLLADLRTMFDALRVRVGWMGNATPDEMMLACAVFGLGVSPLGKGLFTADAAASGSSGGCSSCGGGCGGGGCGGCGS